MIFGAALDAHPRVARIDYGPIPFFAIHHDNVSRRKEFAISSAGFWMQHAGSEWILSARPHLKDERAPFVKGLLAFNLVTSAVYSASAAGRFGPPERDPRSMAVSLGRNGVPEPAIGALVLAPAVLDFYRYEHPEARWAAWAFLRGASSRRERGVRRASVTPSTAARFNKGNDSRYTSRCEPSCMLRADFANRCAHRVAPRESRSA